MVDGSAALLGQNSAHEDACPLMVNGKDPLNTQDLFAAPPNYPPRSTIHRDCVACGACCSAPDIAALAKPLGVPCVHLGADVGQGCLCAIYATRPQVCRSYAPDWVCGEVAPLPTLQARIARFLEIYGLELPQGL